MPQTLTLNPSLSISRHFLLKLTSCHLLTLKMVLILSLILIISLLVFYIFQINALVSESYLLQSYQKKLNEESLKNEALLINSAQVNSLGNIKKKIQELGFEKVEKVHYIRVLETQIVTK